MGPEYVSKLDICGANYPSTSCFRAAIRTAARARSGRINDTDGIWEKRQRTRTGRGPDAGHTLGFKETDADRTRGRGRFSLGVQ
eukprot:gene20248-biopygen13087